MNHNAVAGNSISQMKQGMKPRMLLVNDELFLLEAYVTQLGITFEMQIAENGMQAVQLI